MTATSLPFDLTGRQAEVADAMVKYGCAKMAARELGISFRTVEGTMKRIREKMGVPNQVLVAVKRDRFRRSAA